MADQCTNVYVQEAETDPLPGDGGDDGGDGGNGQGLTQSGIIQFVKDNPGVAATVGGGIALAALKGGGN